MIEQRVAEGSRGQSLTEPPKTEPRTGGSGPAALDGEAEGGSSAWEGYSLETLTRLLDS